MNPDGPNEYTIFLSGGTGATRNVESDRGAVADPQVPTTAARPLPEILEGQSPSLRGLPSHPSHPNRMRIATGILASIVTVFIGVGAYEFRISRSMAPAVHQMSPVQPLTSPDADQRSDTAAYAGAIALHGQSRDVGGGVHSGEDASAAESGDDTIGDHYII